MKVNTIPSLVSKFRPGRGRIRLGMLAGPLMIVLASPTACASSEANAGRGPTGKKMQISPSELQIKIRALADPFSGAIEEVVEELSPMDDDPEWRKRLLIWQINMVNAIQTAIFQPRPLAALFDTWALVEQLRVYSETGPGSVFPREARQIVFNAIDGMEVELLRIATEAGGQEGALDAQRLVREWAVENPNDRFVVRASTASELAQWTARGNMGAMATVKSLGASLDDVMARLDLYSEYVPKQAAWHAELVAGRVVEPSRVERALDDLDLTAAAFDRIALSLEHYPDVVADERRVVLKTLQDERAIILEQLLDKFAQIQIFLNEERIDLVENQLRIEREAIFEAIASERAIIIEAAIKERADTMVELEEMVDQLVERSAIKIVDHFFVRAMQFVAVLLVGLGLIAVILVLLWKRK